MSQLDEQVTQYGRPSSGGSEIADQSALLRWNERMMMGLVEAKVGQA